MRRVYVAGPYRAKNAWLVEQNVRRAEETAMAVCELGHSPFIPQANTRFFNGTFDDQYWLEATAAWLPVSDCVLLVDGWESSEGTIGEIQLAENLGIPVFDRILAMHHYLVRLDNG